MPGGSGVRGAGRRARGVFVGGGPGQGGHQRGQHSLTIAQAQAAYHYYVTASTTAAKQGDATRGLALVADGQWSIRARPVRGPGQLRDAGAAVQLRHAGVLRAGAVQLPAVVRGGGPGHPGRRRAGGQHGHGLRPARPGRAVDPERVRGARSAAPGHRPRQRRLRHQRQHQDTSLLLPPDLVGATQAAVVDEGPAAPAAAAIASGPQTTGMYSTQSAQNRCLQRQGLTYLWLLEGAALPQFDLRTADGGALVIYTMYLNTTIEHPGNVFGAPIAVPAASPRSSARPRAPRATTGWPRTGRTSSPRWTRPRPPTGPRPRSSGPAAPRPTGTY